MNLKLEPNAKVIGQLECEDLRLKLQVAVFAVR